MNIRTETMKKSQSILELDWLKVNLDEVEIAGVGAASRVCIKHIGAACVLAITADDRVVLVKQFRYACQEALFEIPAGKIDCWGGDYFACAQRELAEETPYTAGKLQLLHTFYTAPGFCDEFIHLYLASNLREDSSLQADADEFVEVALFSKQEIRQMLLNNDIRDAKTLIALQYWLLQDTL